MLFLKDGSLLLRTSNILFYGNKRSKEPSENVKQFYFSLDN